MRTLSSLLFLVALSSCRAPFVAHYEGGDGSTREQAVVVVGAPNGHFGPDAEYAWIEEHYPGAKIELQELVVPERGNQTYDILSITTADGAARKVWFNITRNGVRQLLR